MTPESSTAITGRDLAAEMTQTDSDITDYMKRIPKSRVLELYKDQMDLLFPAHLRANSNHLMSLYRNLNVILPEPIKRVDAEFDYAENFYASFFVDRNRRAKEVKSPRYEKVVEKATRLHPTKTYYRLCGDGRVKIVHTNGFTADTGGSIRTPAAQLHEFFLNDGKIVLLPKSTYANRLLTSRQKARYSTQVVDSHIKCAARTREEEATGNYAQDNGLYRDVIEKSAEIQASKEFLEASDADGGEVFFVQTSFNPITGYSYMGLETEAATNHAQEKAKKQAEIKGKDQRKAARYSEYTKETLKELIQQGKIISTGQLISEKPFKEAFEKEFFEADRENRYVETSEMFLDKIEILWEELADELRTRVLKIYPELSGTDESTQTELAERMVLILTNAFNTYLHNPKHVEMEYLGITDKDYENQKFYRYDKHDEEGVKISNKGGHPPYHIPMFVIDSEDIENLAARIELFSTLVRGNRKEGRVKDATGLFSDPEEFAMVIVPVVMQEIISDTDEIKISEIEWKQLEKVKWDDLPKNWDTMENEEFANYLIIKGVNSVLITKGIQSLRRKIAKIYEINQPTAPHLRAVYKTVAPIICDESRETHTIIPFVKVGREENGHTALTA